jgi:hypothetical protein
MQAMLLPETWSVQPKVTALHVAKEPNRSLTLSQAAEVRVKKLSTYAVLPNLSKQRMLMVDVCPPDDVALRTLTWIVAAGDKRYWTWSATKREARGKIRNSLQWELGADKAHVSRAVKRLLDDGVAKITEKVDGREIIHVTPLGRLVFAEIDWRHKLRNAVPELERIAAVYGWQEISLQIDRYMVVEGLDYDRRSDIVYAAKTQLEHGVNVVAPTSMPKSWAK